MERTESGTPIYILNKLSDAVRNGIISDGFSDIELEKVLTQDEINETDVFDLLCLSCDLIKERGML